MVAYVSKPAPLGRNFNRILGASALSNLADGVAKVAVPLVAVRFTESPMAIAGLGIAMTLPWLVLSLPAGALADRLDRRSLMLVANSARAAVAGILALALWADLGSMPLLYVAALVSGVAEVLYDTASQAILPQVVSRDDVPRANSRLYGTEMIANGFVGPPLGGLLVGVAFALALGAPAALWALAVLVLATVRGNFRVERMSHAPSSDRTEVLDSTEPVAVDPETVAGTKLPSLTADIIEGLRFLAGHRVLRTMAVMTGLANIGSSMIFAVFVLFAVGPHSPMGLTDQTYGLLLAVTPVGAVLGSLVATRLADRLGRSACLWIGLVTFTGFAAIPAITANPWIVGAVFAASGMGIMIWNVVAVSLRQQVTPHHLMGRMNSAYRLLAWGLQPLGAGLGGLIGETLGLRPVFVIAAVFSALTAFGMLVVTNQSIDQAIADVEQ